MNEPLAPQTPEGFHRPSGGALEPIPLAGAPMGMPPVVPTEVAALAAGAIPSGWSRPPTADEKAWAASKAAP